MDTLSALRIKDKNESISEYGPCKISTLLSEMQKENKDRYHTTENGNKQMSQSHKSAKPATHDKNGYASSALLLVNGFCVLISQSCKHGLKYGNDCRRFFFSAFFDQNAKLIERGRIPMYFRIEDFRWIDL